jgi:hypothetical protein
MMILVSTALVGSARIVAGRFIIFERWHWDRARGQAVAQSKGRSSII